MAATPNRPKAQSPKPKAQDAPSIPSERIGRSGEQHQSAKDLEPREACSGPLVALL